MGGLKRGNKKKLGGFAEENKLFSRHTHTGNR